MPQGWYKSSSPARLFLTGASSRHFLLMPLAQSLLATSEVFDEELTEFCTLLATPLHTFPCHHHLNIQTILQIHCAGFFGFPVLRPLQAHIDLLKTGR